VLYVFQLIRHCAHFCSPPAVPWQLTQQSRNWESDQSSRYRRLVQIIAQKYRLRILDVGMELGPLVLSQLFEVPARQLQQAAGD
jgi:hypothetical protein